MLDVRMTLPPVQNVNGPLALIVGVDGVEFAVTIVAAEVELHPKPSVAVTEYDPDELTVILCEVAPVLHKFPDA